MLSEEEKKELRLAFWQQFKIYSNKRRLKLKNPGKWLMNDTGIKQINLKFDFTEEYALVGIDVVTRNLDKRIYVWEKLEGLQKQLEEKVPYPLTWEFDYLLPEKKSISRVYCSINEVTIYNKTCWRQVFKFFFEAMYPIELIIIEYKDYLKN